MTPKLSILTPAIGDALSKIAKKQGKEARMKQVGQTLEIFTVQNKTSPATGVKG